MNDRPRIEKLRRDLPVDLFDCGQEALNRFLVRYAFQNQQAEASQTYVALMGDEVVGFYTLVVAQVEYDDNRRRAGGVGERGEGIKSHARRAHARRSQPFLQDLVLGPYNRDGYRHCATCNRLTAARAFLGRNDVTRRLHARWQESILQRWQRGHFIRVERTHQARSDKHHQLGAVLCCALSLEQVADNRQAAQ